MSHGSKKVIKFYWRHYKSLILVTRNLWYGEESRPHSKLFLVLGGQFYRSSRSVQLQILQIYYTHEMLLIRQQMVIDSVYATYIRIALCPCDENKDTRHVHIHWPCDENKDTRLVHIHWPCDENKDTRLVHIHWPCDENKDTWLVHTHWPCEQNKDTWPVYTHWPCEQNKNTWLVHTQWPCEQNKDNWLVHIYWPCEETKDPWLIHTHWPYQLNQMIYSCVHHLNVNGNHWNHCSCLLIYERVITS